MKMTYLLRSNKGRRKKIKLALVVVVIFFLLGFTFQSLAPSATARVTHFVALPFWKVQGFFSENLKLIISFTQSRERIIEENRKLREEIEEIKVDILNLGILETQNRDFKNLLGRGEESEVVLASVLRKPPGIFYDTIIIDAGRNLGVEEGNLVLAQGDVAIGEVEESFQRTSRIRVYSSAGQEIQATIFRSGLAVTALGKGGGDFEVNLPEGADVSINDILVIPGLESNILAQVVEIEAHPTDASQLVFARSPINLLELKWVVIKKQ